ncbi:LuxR C-terminal-related transcriptional regulator [Actinoplanes sp. NPDC049548]|uniref:LuxR C-terminal-related transcriptional regulator n=1 Tax=Actinoplanes sp. NPDC049548 TaxID=3155152 RepID=UPI00341E52E0
MRDRASPATPLAAEISTIALRATGLAERAEAVLRALRPVMAIDAACVTLLRPDRRRQPPLVSFGYPGPVVEHLATPDFLGSVEQLGLHRYRLPLRVMDLPQPAAEIPGWADYMAPAGFGEGIGVPLHTADGRYLGVLATHTYSRTPVSDATRELLAGLAPLIAHALDPMRTVSALAGLVGDALAGVVLTQDDTLAPVPGLPGHRLLTRGSPVLAEVAACYTDGDSQATFHVPQSRQEPARYLRATMLACPDQPPHHVSAVVVLRPPDDLHQLDRREMTVLGLLVAGWPTAQIAARLRVSVLSVHAILDQVRSKLGTRSTAAAVMRAADRGLYLPPALVQDQGPS